MVCISNQLASGSNADVVSEPPWGSRDPAGAKLGHTNGRQVASCGHYMDKGFSGDSRSSLLSLATIPVIECCSQRLFLSLFIHHTGRQAGNN